MKRIGWVSVIALFLLVSVFGFGMLSRQAARPSATPAVDIICNIHSSKIF